MNRIILAGLGLLCSGVISATPLTPEQALSRMSSGAPAKLRSVNMTETRLAYTARSASGDPVAYVFNRPDGGYVLLGGDDVAYPVLGYSDSGEFDPDNVSPAFLWWMSQYGGQIEAARRNNAGAADGISPWREGRNVVVQPYLKSQWNQDAPYNDKCPEYQGKRCVTGCVATSMAQVMNYFKYPEVGEGTARYYCSSIGKNMVMNFSKYPFDWENMQDYYFKGSYSEEEADAVALLMKACGYSVEMGYTPEVSGAQGSSIAVALREYFKYDGNCHSEDRSLYSWGEWFDKVYTNLTDIGPVIINGQSPLEGGHSFVCDGYDGAGYFHFNWGWGGVSDGYYALDAMNPDAQGIGGYAGGFNFSQDAIFGIQKPTGKDIIPVVPRVLLYGGLTGTVTGDKLYFGLRDWENTGWGNATDTPIEVELGAIIESMDNEDSDKIYVAGKFGDLRVFSLSRIGSYYPASGSNVPNIVLPELSDGVYKVTFASRSVADENSEWVPGAAPYGFPNYIYLTVGGGKYECSSVDYASLEFSEVSVDTEIYYGKNARFLVKVSNPSEYDLAAGVTPALFDGDNMVMVGGSSLLPVAPGESYEKEIISSFTAVNGNSIPKSDVEYTLGLINTETYVEYGRYGTVTVHPAPSGSLQISLTNLSIPDTDKVEMEIDGHNYPVLSLVDNLGNFEVKAGCRVTRGFFDGQLSLSICKPLPENHSQLIPVLNDIYVERPFLGVDGEFDFSCNIDFSEGEADQLYFMVFQYTSSSRLNTLGKLAFMGKGSGVNSIMSDDAEVEYFNLQGLKVLHPKKGDILLRRCGSEVRKIVF